MFVNHNVTNERKMFENILERTEWVVGRDEVDRTDKNVRLSGY